VFAFFNWPERKHRFFQQCSFVVVLLSRLNDAKKEKKKERITYKHIETSPPSFLTLSERVKRRCPAREWWIELPYGFNKSRDLQQLTSGQTLHYKSHEYTTRPTRIAYPDIKIVIKWNSTKYDTTNASVRFTATNDTSQTLLSCFNFSYNQLTVRLFWLHSNNF